MNAHDKKLGNLSLLARKGGGGRTPDAPIRAQMWPRASVFYRRKLICFRNAAAMQWSSVICTLGQAMLFDPWYAVFAQLYSSVLWSQ